MSMFVTVDSLQPEVLTYMFDFVIMIGATGCATIAPDRHQYQ